MGILHCNGGCSVSGQQMLPPGVTVRKSLKCWGSVSVCVLCNQGVGLLRGVLKGGEQNYLDIHELIHIYNK